MRYKVGILGATGLVGQRFIELLQNHPWFEIEVLTASQKSVGKTYKEACHWTLTTELPSRIAELPVVESDIRSLEKVADVDLLFSALPGDVARETEEQFAAKYPVISKASAHRMEPDIPLLIPEINPEHLELIEIQKQRRNWEGFICTDPNCSTIQLAISLKPLQKFGLKNIVVSTMQAISGAGYPGVAALDLVDNVIPFIKGEEEKIEHETKKILGKFVNCQINFADIKLSASCNRVNVRDSHLLTVFVELKERISVIKAESAFEQFNGLPQTLSLPSAPKQPIHVRKENNRPQPRFDKNSGRGMSVVLGRIREDPVFSLKYVCLSHNTIRGAAGAGVLSAELLAKKGYL
ncbi:MAG: aspartate-semialdehyde dehydrogenase [Candidatus Heimdallarchaeota archaeon]|nr:aspartate-semialdehyde dehydrogenase [Candidatus Heimdallarchaeota archaeon]